MMARQSKFFKRKESGKTIVGINRKIGSEKISIQDLIDFLKKHNIPASGVSINIAYGAVTIDAKP